MVKHCVSGPEAQYFYEGWVAGESKASKVLKAFKDQGTKDGFFFEPDRFGLTPEAAIRNLMVHGDRLGIKIHDMRSRRLLEKQWVDEQLLRAVPKKPGGSK
jgi:hypothetical protein